MGFREWLIVEKIGWENLPKGWTKKSVEKFARSLTGKTKDNPEGFFTKCYEKLEPELGDEGAKKLCASLKDEYLGTTEWRGKDKDEE